MTDTPDPSVIVSPTTYRGIPFEVYRELFKFTREDVFTLQMVAAGLDMEYGPGDKAISKLLSIAARIEALLPPEE